MEEESIEVYLHPNPEIRSYLTHRTISPPRVGIFRNPLDEEARGALRTLGEIPARIVMDIRNQGEEINNSYLGDYSRTHHRNPQTLPETEGNKDR
ncbi:MAG: hypothetical protein JRH13_07635 [Deltaproteobacteria bacterium]|nr:hypothetical protein [Deltaproteobacteria bacterium]